MRKLFKKLLPVKLKAIAYYLPWNRSIGSESCSFEIRIFTAESKSSIEMIDRKINANNSCYAVFIDNELAHVTWLFKNKLLTKQLGERNVYTAGNSLTYEKFRGRGIYTCVLKTMANTVGKAIIMYVEPDNIASIKAIEKAGFKRKYFFTMIRLMGIKFWCTKHAV